ncbi:MAG: hypothetical protein ACOYJC_04285 [Christensenellales bacterium]|jgi:tRNA U34 5-methylaminomethyl-2-thiouridine-forming methyltransferase MnmC
MEPKLLELKENRIQKRDHLLSMLDIMSLEKQQLETDEIEQLIETMKHWEQLAKKIDVLESEYDGLMKQIIAQGVHIDVASLGLDAVSREIESLLYEIKAIQEQSERIAGDKIAQYRKNVKNMRQSNRRLNSYVNPYSMTWNDGVYFDKKK